MADKLVSSPDDTGTIRRFVDMGDGTHAERVAAVAASSAAGAAGYPAGAVPVAQSSQGANASTVATLPAAVGKTTYITGLLVTGLGATSAGSLNATLAGVLGGSMIWGGSIPAGPSLPITTIQYQFNPPLPASAPNTAITLTLSAFGAGNTFEFASVQGFQQ